MGKKTKFVENDDGSVETRTEDVADPSKPRKEYRLRHKGQNIKAEKKKSFKDQFFMSYADGLKMIAKMRGRGRGGQLVQRRMARHVSLPYHMAGKAAMDEACEWIAQNTVGKYRKEYKGIVVAVGDVETASEPRVIADQYTFHTDVLINQIVFIPKHGDSYEAKVKYVQEGLVVAVVMDMITIHVKVTQQATEEDVGIDDRILVTYTGIRIKNSLCHLRGDYVKMIEKAEIVVADEKEEEEDVGEEEEDVVEVKTEDVVEPKEEVDDDDEEMEE